MKDQLENREGYLIEGAIFWGSRGATPKLFVHLPKKWENGMLTACCYY